MHDIHVLQLYGLFSVKGTNNGKDILPETDSKCSMISFGFLVHVYGPYAQVKRQNKMFGYLSYFGNYDH